MSDEAKITLLYATFNGDTVPNLSDVNVTTITELSQPVGNLKAKIIPTNPLQYQLWKVKNKLPLDHQFHKNWKHLNFDKDNATAEKMHNYEPISFYFDHDPPARHLHIILGLNGRLRSFSGMRDPTPPHMFPMRPFLFLFQIPSHLQHYLLQKLLTNGPWLTLTSRTIDRNVVD
jgi:hypothetical protein